MASSIIRRRSFNPQLLESLRSSINHPLVAALYAARGLSPELADAIALSDLLPADSLMGIDVAVSYLYQALAQQQRIIIIGDFDADGATSVALAVSALRAFGAQHVYYLVPNRFEYGYGLSPEIVAVAAQQKPDLIITVDNGISSVEGVEAARARGIAVLITDHHLPGSTLPAAEAIVNPNQVGDRFPSKCLAGVGVIFYVMLSLRRSLRERSWFIAQGIPEPNMAQFLDLVALGTVADVVPLDANNRILVAQGLRRMREGKISTGMAALLQVACCDPSTLTASDLGFFVGPRLNAAGRLADMSLGIACLLSKNKETALAMAEQLDSLNSERKAIEQTMKAEALEALDALILAKDLPLGLCLFNAEWHQGIIGILAGRLKEQLHRPVAVFTRTEPQYLKASVRSIPGVHIRDVLATVATQKPDILKHFGGHAMAAGLTLLEEHYSVFCLAFDSAVRTALGDQSLQAVIETDGVLPPEYFTISTAEQIRDAGPWGQGFPEPLFDGVFRIVEQRIVGQKHLKLRLMEPESGQCLEAIAFHIDTAYWPNPDCDTVQAVYGLSINHYRGVCSLQLIIKHLFSGTHEIQFL